MPFPEWYLTMDAESKALVRKDWAKKLKSCSPKDRRILNRKVRELGKVATEILGVPKHD